MCTDIGEDVDSTGAMVSEQLVARKGDLAPGGEVLAGVAAGESVVAEPGNLTSGQPVVVE